MSLTLPEAVASSRCRLCEQPIAPPAGVPAEWQAEFGKMLFPIAITLDYGREFAHTACVDAQAARLAASPDVLPG